MRSVILFHFSLLLATTTESARILGVFYYPSYSHQIVFHAICSALSERGHQVVMVTPNPLNDPKLTNLKEINVNFSYDIVKDKAVLYLSRDEFRWKSLDLMNTLTTKIIKAQMLEEQFSKILKDPKEKFDLILVEIHNPIYYALGWRFHAPVIGVSSLGATNVIYRSIGNPTHPLAYPDFMFPNVHKEMKFFERMRNVLIDASMHFLYNFVILPRSDAVVKNYFGPDAPYLGEMQKNLSLLFLNINPIFHGVRPHIPIVVDISRIHIKRERNLPLDLQSLLDNAKGGFVYFSFGTNIKSTHLSTKIINKILNVMGSLPYIVLWKYDGAELLNKYKNVIIKDWFPQQEILAHSNIKAFVTQGGLQSIEEAITNEVPVVGIPFIADQEYNLKKLKERGAAITLYIDALNKDALTNAIFTVIEDQSYKENMKKLHELMEDEPNTAVERVIWWCEYVIRHKGTKHLHSQATEIPLYQYFLLDVLCFLLFLFLFIVFGLYKIVIFCLYICKHYIVKMKKE